MTSADPMMQSTSCHPTALTEVDCGVLVAGRLQGIPASALEPPASVDHVNKAVQARGADGLIRCRAIPASRASSRPGCSLLAA